MKNEYKGKKIGVLGAGVEGLSSARFFRERGAVVCVFDERDRGMFVNGQVGEFERLGVEVVLGKHAFDNLSDQDVLVRSPGISVMRSEVQNYLKSGGVITSQTKVFFELTPSPVIGVTGTKGKGTTSSLIFEMLKESGRDVYLGGNIGKPPLDFLDKLDRQSVVVLELSSFQLQDLNRSPNIAVMLMTTSEHLDYHGDTREYVEAKRNILRFQSKSDFAILNRDYPASNESDIYTEGKVLFVSRERGVEQGCFVKDGAVWIRFEKRANIIEKNIISLRDIILPGKHNLENICAAVMAAVLAGVDVDCVRRVLKTFKGLEHRLEMVGVVDGVYYYDDSFSTTPETTIAAIEAFDYKKDKRVKRASNLVLILGGSSKKSDFGELGRVIGKSENIRGIIGVGEEWEQIKKEIMKQAQNGELPLIVEGAWNMKQIVQAANKIAKRGDVVLLSPACASFGMFRNYKERGEQFRLEVEIL